MVFGVGYAYTIKFYFANNEYLEWAYDKEDERDTEYNKIIENKQ